MHAAHSPDWSAVELWLRSRFFFHQFPCRSLLLSALACSSDHASRPLFLPLRIFSSAQMAAFRRGRSPLSGLPATGATLGSALALTPFLGLPGLFFSAMIGSGSPVAPTDVLPGACCASAALTTSSGSDCAPPSLAESGCAGAASSGALAPAGVGGSALPDSALRSSSKTYPTGTMTATLWMGLVVNLGGDRSSGVFPGLVYLMLTVRT